MLSTTIEYVEDQECMAHDRIEWSEKAISLHDLPRRVADAQMGEAPLGDILAVDMPDDLILIEPCASCGVGNRILGLRASLPVGAGRCDQCMADRPMTSRTSLDPAHPWLQSEWDHVLWPDAEIVGLRFETQTIYVIVRSEDR